MSVAAVFPLVRTRAFAEPFDYAVPAESGDDVTRGDLVAVPLGRSTVIGVVLEIREHSLHEIGTVNTFPNLIRILAATPPDDRHAVGIADTSAE